MSDGSVERGPNYNWQHEAEHYKEEANDLRKLLRLVEQSSDKYANEADSLRLLAESYRAKLQQLLERAEGQMDQSDLNQFPGIVATIARAALSEGEKK